MLNSTTTYFSSYKFEQMVNIKFDPTFLPIVATSFTLFLILYKYVNPFLSNLLVESYKNFTDTQKIDWSTRINSSINSFTVGTICVYMMIADHGLDANPLLYKSYLLKTNLSIVIGYLLSDTFIGIIHYKKIGDPFTMAHHLVSMYAFAYVLTLNVMPYFANFRLLAELSTPLVNIRWFLDTLKFSKTSKAFVLNGILMTLVFFFVRILAMPIYWWKVYTVAITPLWSHMGHFRFVLISVCLVLDIINLYWFSKMVRGCLRILSAMMTMIPFVWFTEGEAGTYLLTFMAIVTVICFTLSFITQNHSQVDKLWSFLPPIYCFIVVVFSSLQPRVLLMNTLAWMWGIRLSYNFYRKDGYTWAGEDYRWPILRKIVNNRFLFELFDLTFIAIFQNILLLFIATPIFYVSSHRTAPLNLWDLVCTALFFLFFIIEVTADQQQWNFHLDKQVKHPSTKDGFLRKGLFKYSRHPNFFAEICIWWVFYAFTFSVRPFAYFNWTILGTIALTLLINGSTTFTEWVSSKKYPKYKEYQKTTSRLIPWFASEKIY